MKITNLLLLFTLLFSPFFVNGQNCISNSSVEIGDCNPDGSYTAFVEFDYTPNADSVQIYFDGAFFGNHPSANQPIVLSPLAGDSLFHNIEIVSVSSTLCQDSIVYQAPFCTPECMSSIKEISSFCTDSMLNLVINYSFVYPESAIHIYVNDEYVADGQIGTNVTQTVSVANSANSVYEVILRDAELLSCSDTSFWQVSPCVENCIAEYDYSIDCQDDGANDFTLLLPALNDFVNVYYDGNYSGVAGGDSTSQLTIYGLVSSSVDLSHEVTFCYQNNPSCCSTITYTEPACEPLACDTELIFLNAATTCLTDSMYQLNIVFQSDQPTREYMISGNFGTSYGPFTGSVAQGNFILADIVLTTNNVGAFSIYEVGNTICTLDFEVEVDCEASAECNIEILNVNVDCNIEGLFLEVEYNAVNVTTSTELFLNGEYIRSLDQGTGNTTSLYVSDPGGVDNYLIEIRDAEFLTCADSVLLEDIACDPCQIISNTFSWDCQNDGTYTFTFENLDSTPVEVFLDSVSIGTHTTGTPDIVVENLSAEFPGTPVEVMICSEVLDCCVTREFNVPECAVQDTCEFVFIEIGESVCNEDETYNTTVFFEITNYQNDTVSVYVNEIYYGEQIYTTNGIDLSNITPRTSTNSDMESVVICSTVDENCCMEVQYLAPECPVEAGCFISDVVVEYECISDTAYTAYVYFNYQGISGEVVKISDYQNNLVGFYDAREQPIPVPLDFDPNTTNQFGVIIQHLLDPDCVGESEIITVECDPVVPCAISNVEAVTTCSVDGSTFGIVLTYEYEGPSDQVEISLNGESYGLWDTQSPTIDLGSFTSLNSAGYEIEIIDIDTSLNCNYSTFLMAPICEDTTPCSIELILSDTIDCNMDGTYNINISYSGGNDSNSLVDVYVNDEYYNSYLDSGIIALSNISSGINTDFDIFTICLHDFPDCCATAEYLLPNCEVLLCDISDVSYTTECDGDSLYYIGLDFFSENTSGSVQILENGTSMGFFDVAEKPFQIGPFIGENGHTIEIVDAQNSTCSAGVEFFFDGCSPDIEPCAIQYVEIVSSECNGDGTFNMTAEYGYENADNTVVDVFLNDSIFGFYDLGTPVVLTDIPLSITNEVKTIKICINDNPDCCRTMEYQQPSCNTTDCDIRDVTYDIECEGDSLYYADISYLAENSSDSVEIIVNGNSMGFFDTANQPHQIGPLLTSFGYNVDIIDSQFENCIGFTEFSYDGCDTSSNTCVVEYIEVDSIVCNNDGTFNMTAYYGIENANNDFVDVFLNGDFYGFFDIGTQVTLSNIPISLSTEITTLTICINENPDCCYEVNYTQPECQNETDCYIGNIEVETECDSNGMVYFNFYFETQNTSGEVIIRGNDINYGFFGTTSLPAVVGPLDPDLNEEWEFMILDSQNDACQAILEVGAVECFNPNECFIGNLTAETDCDSTGMAYFYLFFDAMNTSGEVNVNGNGTDYGFFGAASQPIVLGPFDLASRDDWEFSVLDSQDDGCQTTLELGIVECFETPCLIEGIEVYDIDCINDFEYAMSIDFEVSDNLNLPFTFYINGELMNSAFTNALPLNLFGVLANDSSDVEVIKICLDGTADECCLEYTYESPACLSNSVDATLIDDVILSPNPTKDMINIAHIPNEVVGIHIIDNLGRSVEQRSASEMMQFDVSNYTEGIYMVQFYTADNRVMSKRFIKMN